MRWAALLKSINAGKNVAMADLRAFLTDQGMTDVKTLLASGNAVFTADEKDAESLERTLHDGAVAALGLDTDWFLRSKADLEKVIAHDPFRDAARERPHHMVVFFYRDPVDVAKVKALAESYGGPERLHAHGRELYVDFPEGIGRSNLTPAMNKARFPKATTARNWNTVRKIIAAL